MTLLTKNTFIWLLVLAALTIYFVPTVFGSSFPDSRTTGPIVASSTAYSLTSLGLGGSSTRIVATSTGTGRTGLSVQVVGCTTNNGVVWISFNDKGAATSTGMFVTSTSTVTFSDSVPMVYGSIRAAASYASCTLLVNEFKPQF